MTKGVVDYSLPINQRSREIEMILDVFDEVKHSRRLVSGTSHSPEKCDRIPAPHAS